MNKIHISWEPLFDLYDIDLEKLYINNIVYPPYELVFRVFEMDVKDIKILLLGQDPYHNPNQANGLSFSVYNNVKIPPSLKNIFKEINLEFPERNYKYIHGNLEEWFYREKIFLLNASLTVLQNKPNSHIKLWTTFTDDVIDFISNNNDKCIFLLLGNFAKSKSIYIKNKNNIITEKHPSPLAQGFIGSYVFTRIENLLGYSINWQN